MRGESSKGKESWAQKLTGSSEKLPETLSKEMKGFFEALKKLTLEEINDSARKWQCPACPAAFDLHQGFHSLAIHTRPEASKRPHRDFAELLKEQLQRRRTSLVIRDREIVWPPMVVIMNTLQKGDDDKWVGMESQELLENFSSFAAVRAQHSYGPQGRHRGISLLIFEDSIDGYLEAERLHDHLSKKGTGRQAWDDRSSYFDHGGRPQLYGYLATENDLEEFDLYSRGTQRVEYEMIRYQEMVVSELNKRSEDSQQLEWLEQKFDTEQRLSETLEQLLKCTNDELRRTLDEVLIVRKRSKMYHEENQEAMDFPDKFEKDKFEKVKFEKVQQEERRKAEEYVLEREKLNKIHEQKRNELKMRFLEKEYDSDLELNSHEEKKDALKRLLAMVKEFDAALTRLMKVRFWLCKKILQLLQVGSN